MVMLSPAKRVQWNVILVLSTVGMTVALTLIFLSMRAVMAVGGSCGSGGPYVIAQECPDAVGGVMGASFPGLFLFGGLMAVSAAKLGAPQIVSLAWPALFISLGWNFLEFADQGEAGTDSGLVVCGVLFLVMGAGPLLFGGLFLRASRRRAQNGVAAPGEAARKLTDAYLGRQGLDRTDLSGGGRAGRDPFTYLGTTVIRSARDNLGAGVGVSGSHGSANSLVADLQALAALRASGALTDAEFEAAKQAALRQGGAR